MDPKLTLIHMAAQAEHDRLQARAEHAWHVAEARANRAARQTASSPIRHSLGAALVRIGERLAGRPHVAPRPARVSTKAAA